MIPSTDSKVRTTWNCNKRWHKSVSSVNGHSLGSIHIMLGLAWTVGKKNSSTGKYCFETSCKWNAKPLILMDYYKMWALSEKQTGYNVNQLYCVKLTITYKACMMIAVLVSRNNTPFWGYERESGFCLFSTCQSLDWRWVLDLPQGCKTGNWTLNLA